MQFKLKARLVLCTIAVTAIVVANYAFKARATDSICIRGPVGTQCTLEVPSRTLSGWGTHVTVAFATDPPCPKECTRIVPIYVGF